MRQISFGAVQHPPHDSNQFVGMLEGIYISIALACIQNTDCMELCTVLLLSPLACRSHSNRPTALHCFAIDRRCRIALRFTPCAFSFVLAYDLCTLLVLPDERQACDGENALRGSMCKQCK